MTDNRVTALTDTIVSEGISVTFCPLPGTLRGAYDKQNNRIYVRSHMTNRHTLGALAHEYAHARLGHDGHQSPTIEKRVDEYAAQMLVDPHEYAALEPLYEGNAVSIAGELDVPVWVVEAWQRSYTRTRHTIEDDYRVRCGLAM